MALRAANSIHSTKISLRGKVPSKVCCKILVSSSLPIYNISESQEQKEPEGCTGLRPLIESYNIVHVITEQRNDKLEKQGSSWNFTLIHESEFSDSASAHRTLTPKTIQHHTISLVLPPHASSHTKPVTFAVVAS